MTCLAMPGMAEDMYVLYNTYIYVCIVQYLYKIRKFINM